MDFFVTGSSGVIFLTLGLTGMAVSAAAALIVGRLLRHRERRIREQIWQEYR